MTQTDNSRGAPQICLVALFVAGSLVYCLAPQWTFYENYHFGWAVPFLAAYLFWRRWNSRPIPEPVPSFAGPLASSAVALLLLFPSRLVQEANSLWRTSAWPVGAALVTLLLATLYVVGGRPWLRHFLFPACFLGVGFPWPGAVENAFLRPLTTWNTNATVELLNFVGIPALAEGNVIATGRGPVGIDEACSGIRSLQASLMLALFFGEFHRLRPSRKTALALVGMALALLANLGRTFILAWVCSRDGSAAVERWHDPVGVSLLVVCFFGVLGGAVFLRQSRATKGSKEPSAAAATLEPEARSGGPDITTTVAALAASPAGSRQPTDSAPATWMALGVVASVCLVELSSQAWFSSREPRLRANARWSFQKPTRQPAYQEFRVSGQLQNSFHADEAVSCQWKDSHGATWSAYYFRWPDGSPTAQLAKGHWPEICLVSAGKQLVLEPEDKHITAGGLSLPFREYGFIDQGRPLYVFHCVWEDRTCPARIPSLGLRINFLSRLQAAWDGKRNVGQRLLELAVWGYASAPAAEAAVKRELDDIIRVEKP